MTTQDLSLRVLPFISKLSCGMAVGCGATTGKPKVRGLLHPSSIRIRIAGTRFRCMLVLVSSRHLELHEVRCSVCLSALVVGNGAKYRYRGVTYTI